MIAIVDSGGANLSSIQFALERLGAESAITRDPDVIERAEKVILPGVGAAGSVMRSLRAGGLVDCVRELGQPVLGICLGMQILFARSEEDAADCLGLLDGTVSAIARRPGFPVPHMGWNRVHATSPCRLLPAEDEGAHFYFVHSFAAPPGPPVCAVTDYGGPVAAVLEWKNWHGVQFHPERSGAAGARLLERFIRLPNGGA